MESVETKMKNNRWVNILSLLRENRSDIGRLMTDDQMRIRIQFFCIFLLFVGVSVVMTVMNIFTHWLRLACITGVFGALNIINLILCLINDSTEKISRILFAVEFVSMFTLFAILGDPEGFSILWVALLPACGILLYRLKYGSIISLSQLAILVFLFWTPIGRLCLQYEYTSTFLFRFPVLYCAFFFVGVLFETIRANTQKELVKTRNKFEYLANHDPLTELFNRNGFNREMDLFLENNAGEGFAFAILDIDNFKSINDTYGHQNGDVVLRELAEILVSSVDSNGAVCRWGGEEFSIFFLNEYEAEGICNSILSAVSDREFKLTDISLHITVSIGLTVVPKGAGAKIGTVVTQADDNLYEAKDSGKNRVVVSTARIQLPAE